MYLFKLALCVVTPQGFDQEGENIEEYLQLNYAVSAAEKISICWIRGLVESLGNDDVSIVHARK